ncbi:MAG TPA: hypothetical protein VNG32_00145 [Candidatus Dormibacteraeota bacterium]|nr:hypothetical protein [Candidatus Dormibacteraeota bacterium]
MHELPTIDDLSEVAQATYPDSPVTTALVAHCKPSVLQQALAGPISQAFASSSQVEIAKRLYQSELSKAPDRNITVDLCQAAQQVIATEQEYALARCQAELSKEIYSLQDRLARPLHMAAIILSAVALGGGSAVLMYEKNAHDQVKQGQVAISSTASAEAAVTAGIIGGLGGGVVGTVVGMGLTGREARRRARRIVARA